MPRLSFYSSILLAFNFSPFFEKFLIFFVQLQRIKYGKICAIDIKNKKGLTLAKNLTKCGMTGEGVLIFTSGSKI